MSQRRLWVVAALVASHAVVFAVSPYVHQLFYIARAARVNYENESTVEQNEGLVLSEKERFLQVIVAVPSHLAQEPENDRREWAQNFLAIQSQASWICVEEGEFLGYTGFAFKLHPSTKNLACDK